MKSWWELAPELFADWKLVHLIRDPLKTARSEANRHRFADRVRAPLRYYRAGGGRFFRWALTGREPIFAAWAPGELTMFQWYVVQWIEIENRALRFLDEQNKHRDCVTLHSPHDLNDPQCVREMFRALEVPLRRNPVRLAGNVNRTPRTPTVITEEEERQFAEVIARLPEEQLQIFRRAPYTQMPWRKRLALTDG